MTDKDPPQPAVAGVYAPGLLARYPALVAGWEGCWWGTAGTPAKQITRGDALSRAAASPVLLINAPVTASRMGYPDLSGLDVLELFAFVRPASFCVPTPGGLAAALGLTLPESAEDAVATLHAASAALLAEAARPDWACRPGAYASLQSLARLRWPWAALLNTAIQAPQKSARPLFTALPEWDEEPPRPPPRDVAIAPSAVLGLLDTMVGKGAELRPGQRDFAQAVMHSFRPRTAPGRPNVTLAEAGTGTGKTLGYLAPAALWAHEARGTVWVSTFTKALQRQLDQELSRIYRTGEIKAARTVVRKGRENYLCLLNLEDALQGSFSGRAAILAHLTARWARFTRDGDMVGGDFPGWLVSLFGSARTVALTDRRGECVYAGCPHYRRCFIERATRKTRSADIVVANHALVMINAARGKTEGAGLQRIIFDEGHHLFDAADSTFAVRLSGTEAIELRRWLLGPERSTKGRRRGLEARLAEVLVHDDACHRLMEQISTAAQTLPADGWMPRVQDGDGHGPVERLLETLRRQVFARADGQEAGYGLETEITELLPAVVDALTPAAAALAQLSQPMAALATRLEDIIEDQPDWLDAALRARLEGAAGGLAFRLQMLRAWQALLARAGGPADPDFVDWIFVDRSDAREYDIGLQRHWLDPSRPLATTVIEPAHGVLVTSATLRDRGADSQGSLAARDASASNDDGGAAPAAPDWQAAEQRVGLQHISRNIEHCSAESPFDYGQCARVFVVTDVRRGDIGQLAGAYRRLIEASGGGALGLFTAISRLKAVFARIAGPLSQSGLPLLAQHVDPIDTGTLVDMFRADPHASLLGTDALRDGVDVPGESLRLAIMEGIPWPRPTILHAARRAALGGSDFDNRVTRARLAQAFGRLIRRRDDRGVFVLLGAATPSRLLTAFPAAVPVVRLPLAQAIAATRDFLADLPADEPSRTLKPWQEDLPDDQWSGN